MSRTLLRHWKHLQDCQDTAHMRDLEEVQRLHTSNKVCAIAGRVG